MIGEQEIKTRGISFKSTHVYASERLTSTITLGVAQLRVKSDAIEEGCVLIAHIS